MIHVCFCLHDADGRYSKFTGTTMASIFANTSAEVTVHILHDNTLTQDNHDKFIYLAGRYGQLVKFYNVEKLCADKIAEMVQLVPQVKTARVGIGAFFKLLIPKVLSPNIDRCIYLDSDIIVNLDISELWRVDLGDKPLGAVTEIVNGINSRTMFAICFDGLIAPEDYFNSGVLLINLNVLRAEEENILKALKFRGENPRYRQFDQTIFNYCFAKKALKLPLRFNRFVACSRTAKEFAVRKKMYHFTGLQIDLSLHLNMDDPLNRLWMDYFLKTPWFDTDSIGRFYERIQQLHVDLKASMANISAIMSGKTRVFVTIPQNLEAMKQIFTIRPDEEIIYFESPDSLPKLLDAMKRGQGQKVFFVMLPNFPFKILTEAGFVPGRDFLNGFDFLSEANGMKPLNSYQFVKAL